MVPPRAVLKRTLQQAAGNVLPCGSASHLAKDFIYLIRSLFPFKGYDFFWMVN